MGRWLPFWRHYFPLLEGYRYPAEELVRRVCGQGLTDDDFVSYLAGKCSELYGLTL